MNLLSLLLRVLLCVSLIANGAGAAQASMRMQGPHEAYATDRQAPTVAAASCHASGAIMPASSHGERALHATPEPPYVGAEAVPTGKSSTTGCCKGKGCTCVCPQHVPGAALTVRVDRLAPRPQLPEGVMHADYAPPRLPHLIRPPIG